MAGSDVDEQLQELVDRQLAKGRVHNILVGIQSGDGRVDIGAAAGHADASGTVAMTYDTPYYLASITKMYTATVTMKLAASGEIALEAPISAYLDKELIEGIHVVNGIDHGGRITVSQLLDQTSGLADYFEGKSKGGVSLVENLRYSRDRKLAIEDVLAIVRQIPPKFAPGDTKAHYSDTNYALLGAIIAAVTGGTVSDNFEQRIFKPLGLADTHVFDHTRRHPQPAALYDKNRPVEIPLAMSSFDADGGVVSTVTESLRFLRAFFGGELLAEDQLAFMTRRWRRIVFPLRYGVGLMRFELPRLVSPLKAPPELIGHSGATGSFAFYNPKRDIYLAGTMNQMDKPSRPFQLMMRMIRLLD